MIIVSSLRHYDQLGLVVLIDGLELRKCGNGKLSSYFDSWGMVYILDHIRSRIYCMLVAIQKAGV